MKNLYQAALKVHYTNPVGRNRQICPTHQYDGYNASCGDEISLFLQIGADDSIQDIAFQSDCCAICTASASLLCQISIGNDRNALESDFKNLEYLLNHQSSNAIEKSSKFECLLPIGHHPGRINCALLPWQAAISAFYSPINTQVSQAAKINA